jgi:pimeloyl-ACP methyl ester carboxylesterase
VHYVAWGRPGRRGLVFVHGGAAHAHWWTHVAAHFARDYRVLALDLSGHGDNDHRDEYPLTGWTDEVIAVADHGGVEGPVVVVGHSMGGFVTIATAALHPDRLEGAIVCDSPVTAPDAEVDAARGGSAFGAPHLRQRGGGPGPLPHRAAAGPLSPLRPRPRGPPLAAPGRGRLAPEVRPPGVRPVRRGHALGGPALPVPGPLPAGAAPLRARAGHRGHRRRHVRPAGPGGAGHRDRRGRPPRHARPAAPAAHRAAHAGRRLGPAQNRRSDAPL